MEIEKKKKPTAALLAVVFSGVVFGGVMVYHKINSPLRNVDKGNKTPITAAVVPPVPKNPSAINASNISNFSSPFSQIPSNPNVNETFLPGQVPPIPNGMLPSASNVQVTSSLSVTVKAIFYGGDSSQNMAIVAINNDEITVKEGSNSKIGFISSITKDSVMINNTLYVMDRGAKSTNISTPINSNHPPAFPFNILVPNQK